MIRGNLGSLLCVTAFLASAPALAQQGAGAPAAPRGLDSVLVTARKVEQDLQSTAEAVSAFQGAELDRRGAEELKSLSRMIPNFRCENSPGTGTTAAITIRGISQPDPLITGDPSVGLYVDGVYHPRLVGGNFSFFDVERVEVLRGPQGTLYGKNTPAGALNVWSRRPDGSFGGYLRGTLGSNRRRDLEGAVGFPIAAEGLSGRLAFLSRDDEGYVRNHSAAGVTGDVNGRVADQNGQGTRASLLWNASEALEVHAQGFRYRERRQAGFPNQVSLVDPSTIDLSGDLILIDPGSFDTAAWAAFAAAADEDDVYLTFRGRQDLDVRGGSLAATYDLGAAELRYLAGQRTYQFLNAMDLDGSPFSLFDIGRPENPQDEKSRASSHELSLNGAALAERLRYTSGVFFFDERSSSNANQYFDSASFMGGSFPLRVFGDVVSRIRSWAGYAQGTYALVDHLELTLGVRHTEERREITRFVEGAVPRTDRSKRWDATTWLAGLELQATDDLFVYAKASTGYRSGGWNGRASALEELNVPFDEEYVTAYELGVKREALDGRLRANAALFYQKYKDLQTTVIQPSGGNFVSLLVNSGNADISGGELELWALPIPELRLGGSLGWNWFRFARGSDHPQNSPALNYALWGEHALPPFAFGELSSRLELQYQSRSFASEALEIPAFGLVNARVALRMPAYQTEVALLAENLLDRKAFVAGVDFLGAGFGYQTRYYTPGRRLALEVTYVFGSED
jgi:iron complex outermembrane receptor protein